MLKAKGFLDNVKYLFTENKYSVNMHKILGIAVYGLIYILPATSHMLRTIQKT